MPKPHYDLLGDPELDHLIIHDDQLTADRRSFLAAHLRGMTPTERDEAFAIYASCMPADEFGFVVRCFGIKSGYSSISIFNPPAVPIITQGENENV